MCAGVGVDVDRGFDTVGVGVVIGVGIDVSVEVALAVFVDAVVDGGFTLLLVGLVGVVAEGVVVAEVVVVVEGLPVHFTKLIALISPTN